MEAIEHATHTAALGHTINTFIYITKHLFKDWYKMSGADRKFSSHGGTLKSFRKGQLANAYKNTSE